MSIAWAVAAAAAVAVVLVGAALLGGRWLGHTVPGAAAQLTTTSEGEAMPEPEQPDADQLDLPMPEQAEADRDTADTAGEEDHSDIDRFRGEEADAPVADDEGGLA